MDFHLLKLFHSLSLTRTSTEKIYFYNPLLAPSSAANKKSGNVETAFAEAHPGGCFPVVICQAKCSTAESQVTLLSPLMLQGYWGDAGPLGTAHGYALSSGGIRKSCCLHPEMRSVTQTQRATFQGLTLGLNMKF